MLPWGMRICPRPCGGEGTSFFLRTCTARIASLGERENGEKMGSRKQEKEGPEAMRNATGDGLTNPLPNTTGFGSMTVQCVRGYPAANR